MHGSYKPGQTVFDTPDDFDTWDRCITRGLPVSMLPRNYNNGLRIVQSPGYVVILLEMAHEARIIPTDGRAFLDPSIKQYMGESRGRWEGNTLVVETKNFNGKPAMTNSGVPGSPPLNPSTENMRFTERFTRTTTIRSSTNLPSRRLNRGVPVVRRISDEAGQQVRDVRVRLPRGQHCHSRLHRNIAFRAR
jgi:hypothetical protein